MVTAARALTLLMKLLLGLDGNLWLLVKGVAFFAVSLGIIPVMA